MNDVMGLASSAASPSSTPALKNSVSAGKANIPTIPQSMPMMLGHQYVMGQAGHPIYGLQQPVYSYEDMQMLQSKLSTMGYYDLQYQPPTSMTGRDPNMGSIAYTAADGKYGRSDVDASAAVTALSQSQAAAQAYSQAYLNPALPPGYGYYIPGGMMAGGIPAYAAQQFLPVNSASIAHAAAANRQLQRAAAYGSPGYSSAYESLSQAQDFSKGAYRAASQNQVKAVPAGSGAVTDMSSPMYKSHSQLSKPYDRPGVHGTPPPYNLATSQAAGALAASAAAYSPQYIPVMAPGQHQSLLHQMQQEAGGTAGMVHRGSQGPGQPKNKQNYAYWGSN